jgi:small-conductance mechanosensitive channel
VRVTAPLLAAVVFIGGTAVTASLAALSALAVLGLTIAVALGGAIVMRRTLGSLLAGVGLLLVRPYAAGERLRLNSPCDGAPIEAEVVRVGLVNTTLATDDGVLVVPNTSLLRGLPAEPEPGRAPAGCR